MQRQAVGGVGHEQPEKGAAHGIGPRPAEEEGYRQERLHGAVGDEVAGGEGELADVEMRKPVDEETGNVVVGMSGKLVRREPGDDRVERVRLDEEEEHAADDAERRRRRP